MINFPIESALVQLQKADPSDVLSLLPIPPHQTMSATYVLLQFNNDPFSHRFEDLESRPAFTVYVYACRRHSDSSRAFISRSQENGRSTLSPNRPSSGHLSSLTRSTNTPTSSRSPVSRNGVNNIPASWDRTTPTSISARTRRAAFSCTEMEKKSRWHIISDKRKTAARTSTLTLPPPVVVPAGRRMSNWRKCGKGSRE